MSTVEANPYSDETACFDRWLDTANVQVVARFTIEGDPASKARPRFTGSGYKTRAYTPEKTKTAEAAVAWAFRAAASGHQPDDTHAYGLACVFFSESFQRRDVDNMLKLVSDGLNGVAWGDDSQVYEVTGRRGCDVPENARTEVLVYRMGKKWNPMAQCANCGTAFPIYKSSRPKYCGPECRGEARRRARTRKCHGCGEEFDGVKLAYEAKYCSRQCRDASSRIESTCVICSKTFTQVQSWAGGVPTCSHACMTAHYRARGTTNPKGRCETCGGPTSRKEYTRCRACKTAAASRRRDLREVQR